jgi:hypothetical protein
MVEDDEENEFQFFDYQDWQILVELKERKFVLETTRD